MTLANYIRLLGDLPSKPLEIILDTPGQEKLFQALKERYQSISTWLETLLLGYPGLPDDVKARIQIFKAEAELSAAHYKLALSVYPRSKNPLLRKFNSPEDLWFNLECQFSEIALEFSISSN